jgi:hypothetical protein
MAQNSMEQKGRSRLSFFDGVLIVGGGAIAVIVAFALLSAIVGFVWFVVKVLVVVAIVSLLARFLFRRRS